MNELIALAIDSGALVKPHPMNAETTLITFTFDELVEFVTEVKKQNILPA